MSCRAHLAEDSMCRGPRPGCVAESEVQECTDRQTDGWHSLPNLAYTAFIVCYTHEPTYTNVDLIVSFKDFYAYMYVCWVPQNWSYR